MWASGFVLNVNSCRTNGSLNHVKLQTEENREVSFIWIDFFQKITAISDSFNKKMSHQIIISEKEISCDFFGIFWQANGLLISPKYTKIDISGLFVNCS